MGDGTMRDTYNERKQRVYFIQCERTKAVKIGVSFEPEKRLAQLQTGSPGKLVLLGWLPGGEADEQKLHAAYAEQKLHGEWFGFSDEHLKTIVDGLRMRVEREREHWIDTEPVEPDISYITSIALGFEIGVWGYPGQAVLDESGGVVEIIERDPPEFTVCPIEDGAGSKGDTFWWWYWRNCEIWHPSAAEAASRFLSGWREWLRLGNDPN